ncbi:Succinate dehydrogenase complex subunit C [Fasciola gigantica]|uniref:Succinate dehydrogenase complex subunit C n=1 Tax=Fasciola gigantica TaxID=46835 RepID=A0A504YDU0_FASGI|nr:Succinate dehydrogenase complex subunit C [Fasciola gigantica]
MAKDVIWTMLSYRAACLSGRSLFGNSTRSLQTQLSVNNVAFLRPSGLKQVVKAGKGSTSQQVRGQAQKEMQAFWERNIQEKRPWSPHLSVYSPPLVMRFSFLHRATGIAMAFVWMGVGCSAFLFTGHYEAMLDYVRNLHLGSLVITGCKFVLCYPLVYHYMNGMRHLAWDYAIGFPIKTCNMTGMTVLSVSLVAAAALACVRL